MKTIIVAVLAGIATLAIWLGGIRIFIIQPIGALPDGITTVVAGMPSLRLVDSPDALCYRTQHSVTLICRMAAMTGVANNGKILLRLPYSSVLYRLTGAPEVDG